MSKASTAMSDDALVDTLFGLHADIWEAIQRTSDDALRVHLLGIEAT